MENNPQIAQQDNGKKSIYDVSYGSIFARNFIAGFSHTLGAVILYVIIIGALYYFTATLIFPKFQPFFSGIISIFSEAGNQSQTATPDNLQEMMGVIQPKQ